MSTDQKLGSDTALLLLKELTIGTLSLSRTGDQNYQNLRGPMGLDMGAVFSLPLEDRAKLTNLENPQGVLEALDNHVFSIDDLKTAVSDLLKESRDLDGAALIAPQIEALVDQLNELDNESPIDHQQLFENTLTSLAEANISFGQTDGIMEDFLTNKQGQEAALDQMHEDEFQVGSQIVTLVLGKIAAENGVDIEAGMSKVEQKLGIGIEPESPALDSAPDGNWGYQKWKDHLENGPQNDLRAMAEPNAIEDPQATTIVASHGQRITPDGLQSEVKIENFEPPRGIEGFTLIDHMQDPIPQSVLEFAAAEAADQGIALNVQAVRHGGPEMDPEYRFLNDSGEEVSIGTQWQPETGQVFVRNDPNAVELTGPSNGSSGGSSVINTADGPDITNSIEVERPQPEPVSYEPPPKLTIGEIAHDIEGDITRLHEGYGLELTTPEQSEAYNALLDKLHDIQAGGDPEGLNEMVSNYRDTYDSNTVIPNAIEITSFGANMDLIESNIEWSLKRNDHDTDTFDSKTEPTADTDNELAINQGPGFDTPAL